jgi:hypothetical protein
MPNGFHSHYCSRCQAQKDCAQITHCRKAPNALCADCVYDDYMAGTLTEKKIGIEKEPETGINIP